MTWIFDFQTMPVRTSRTEYLLLTRSRRVTASEVSDLLLVIHRHAAISGIKPVSYLL